MSSDVWLITTVFMAVILVAVILFLIMGRGKRKPLEAVESIPSETGVRWPLSVRKTVTHDVVNEAKDKLRILDLEREILSYAVRRLYEAHGEGKISEEERDRLAEKYKEDLKRIKDEITHGETLIALNELERMQEEFVKLFTERYEELNKRIGELRTISGFMPLELEKPLEEEKAVAPPQPAEKAAPLGKKEIGKPKAPTEKSEAEEKVERIMAEVERVLERLGQMEVEE